MKPFYFYHPIEIRYGDIDAQRHVNNAHYFTFMEQARANYLMKLGLWDGGDFDHIGIILAEQSCTYLAPIILQQQVEVGVRTERMGKKSLEMVYSLRDAQTLQELATGWTTLVAYDYQQSKSIPIPDGWRSTIENFEANTHSGMNSDDEQKVKPS